MNPAKIPKTFFFTFVINFSVVMPLCYWWV